MKQEQTIYLIDGSAYIYRAYHAIRGLANSKGFPTNAVFGFTRMLQKIIEERSPRYIAMFFDAKGPTFRHAMYEKYKANRPPMPEDLSSQIPYIKDVTRGFNIPVLEMAGYEADDLIGTVACEAQQAGFFVVMVTGDKDFMQLITDNIVAWDPMKERMTGLDEFRQTYGLEPHQLIDVMGLSGDTADNIPGVPGIGLKTALSLIQQFGSMRDLYQKVHQIPRKKQSDNLIQYQDQAFLSRKLVTIDTRAPLSVDFESFKLRPPDRGALAGLFKTLEFRQLQQAFSMRSDLEQKNYRLVLDMEALGDLVRCLSAAARFALDTETTSTDPMTARLVGLSFSIKAHEAFYVPCGHDDAGAARQLDLETVLARLKPVLENGDINKIGQNIKYDWIVLKRHGIHLAGVAFDTMLASYLINPSKRAHNLDQIALDHLNYKKIAYEDVAGKGKKALFSEVSLENAGPYACEDADITLMASDVLGPMLQGLGLSALFHEVEMPLVPVLMKMEMTGIGIDRQKLAELSKSFQHQLEQIEQTIFTVAGEEFNIKSSQQLGQILFEKLKLPVQKKTAKKTGYSTDVDVLSTLAVHHELPALILRHRTLAKLKSTYADALMDLVNPETRRIHTSYNQTVTATGRLSSSAPNLQNIPVRTGEGLEIRSAFIPRKGWHLVSADYSQIELRILAHYAEDQILIKAFMEDEDIHARTAGDVFQTFPAFVTPELRRQAKAINFGIIYGMSAFGLSRQLGISQKMARTYIDNYFARYKGVKRFMDETIETARKTAKTSTLLGRIRLLPDIQSLNANTRMFAERTAVNTPIQGTAADLIKIAMIRMDAALSQKGFAARMLLSVHDELVFEVPPDELDAVTGLVKEVMEHAWQLKVPLKVNVNIGKNWAECH